MIIKFKSIAILTMLFMTACAPVHQVVKAKVVKNEAGERKFFYGVTYNHTLIPEYTKSAKGQYAESYEEAASLYQQRAAELDSWIGNKYRLTNSTWYHLTSPIPKIALIAVYPFVVPVEWLGERLFPDPSLGGRRTIRQITSDYFEPTFDQPALQIVSIPPETD